MTDTARMTAIKGIAERMKQQHHTPGYYGLVVECALMWASENEGSPAAVYVRRVWQDYQDYHKVAMSHLVRAVQERTTSLIRIEEMQEVNALKGLLREVADQWLEPFHTGSSHQEERRLDMMARIRERL